VDAGSGESVVRAQPDELQSNGDGRPAPRDVVVEEGVEGLEPTVDVRGERGQKDVQVQHRQSEPRGQSAQPVFRRVGGLHSGVVPVVVVAVRDLAAGWWPVRPLQRNLR
jgi:hypothetical protein